MEATLLRTVPGTGQVIEFQPRTGELSRSTAAIRVLLADGAGLVRAGIRALLEHESGIEVVAEAANGDEAVALAAERCPDVALVDVRLPGLKGLEAARLIAAASGGRARVLMLTEHGTDEELFGALRAGAGGLMLRDSAPGELRRAVRVLAGGGAQLSPRFTQRLIDEFGAQPHPERPVPEELAELTPREREVMGLLATGLSNAEIAQRLVISRATAKTHVSRAMVKLHVRDRAKLVAIAYKTGLIGPRAH